MLVLAYLALDYQLDDAARERRVQCGTVRSSSARVQCERHVFL